MPDLLLELRSEEIPARMQARAAEDLKRLVTSGLVEAGLTYAHAAAFATPRRLTLAVEGIPARSPDLRQEKRGPKEGAPEKAVDGFLRGNNISRGEAEVRETPKGRFWFATLERPGRAADGIVGQVVSDVIRGFPWPKSMRWGDGSLRWVRPLRSILCILTDEEGGHVVPFEVDGIVSGGVTAGHPFMAPETFSVTSFEDYADKLKHAKVILSAEERAEIVRGEAEQQAFARGLEVIEDPDLLVEIAGLVEWPVVLLGEIDEKFHDLPPQVLRTSMAEHQRYLSASVSRRYSVGIPSVPDITHFVAVADRETADGGETILAGNRKVLAARLADAAFFWENDLRVAREAKLAPWLESLKSVTFHAKLGSQADRIERIAQLAGELAPAVGADPEAAEAAARVAKADLASEMVYEFPELQGVMGRYYVAEAGFGEAAARAAEEHYRPLGPSDDVPTEPVSVAVALADKIDTLTGFWAIGETPTGSKDPYALRRAAIGAVKILMEDSVRISLGPMFTEHYIRFVEWFARNGRLLSNPVGDPPQFQQVRDVDWSDWSDKLFVFPGLTYVSEDGDPLISRVDPPSDFSKAIFRFFHDRLKVYLRDRGIRHDVIDACLAMPGADDLTLLLRRAEALQAFLETEDGENLVQGYRRAANILAQAEAKDGVEYSFGADKKFAETDEERALFDALDAAEAEIAPAMEAEDFGGAMAAMAALRGPIDAFFEAVQVNADNQVLRRNRLNLLSRIRATCLMVADLTRLQG